MVLLRPGWEHDYEGRPPVYPIGCSGVITHVERLADGRYNIVLRGLERFRILDEDHERSYRRAIVEPLPDGALTARTTAPPCGASESKLEALLAPSASNRHRRPTVAGDDRKIPSAMADEDLVNALAQYLDLEPLEKQALLEQHEPAHARRVARRAARDEDPDGAHARRVERRALKHGSASATRGPTPSETVRP